MMSRDSFFKKRDEPVARNVNVTPALGMSGQTQESIKSTAPAIAPRPETAQSPERTKSDTGSKLIVGPDINLSGEITACDRLVVEGSVQVTLNRTRAIEIAETGRFTNGKAEVDDAEIAGVYEGSLTVRKRLLIRATGRVSGTVRYGELEIERGGRLAGTVERLAADEPLRAVPPTSQPEAKAEPMKLSA